MSLLARGFVVVTTAVACSKDPPTRPTTATASATSSATATTDASMVITGNTLTLSRKGFVRSCVDEPTVSVAESDGGTRIVDRALPGKGDYFVDGTYHGYGMCDVVVCNPATDIAIPLVEHVAAGQRARPDGQGTAPAYRTVPLTGTITIEAEYFDDAQCTIFRRLTKTIVR